MKDDTRVAVTATSVLTDDRSLIPTLYTNVLFSVRWAVWTLQVKQGKNAPSEMITELKSRKMYHLQSSYARVSTYTSRRLNVHKDDKSNFKSNLFAINKMHNIAVHKVTFHLAGQTGDSFALMSAHKD